MQCRYLCVIFYLFAATNSTGTEKTGYSDFQQEIVLYKLYAVSEFSCAPCAVCVAEFVLNSAQISRGTWWQLPLEKKFSL